jgi:cytochrome P450
MDQAEASYSRDPLGFLDQHFPADGDIVRTGPREFLLGDPIGARDVLRNAAGEYHEHSDFFHTRDGLFGPREAQLDVRREARKLLREFIDAQTPQTLSALVGEAVAPVSDWPDAGNRLTYRLFSPLLLAPGESPKLRALFDRIVERAVLAGARARQPVWKRMLLQFETTYRLSGAIDARRRDRREEARDLLDVIARAGGEDDRTAMRSEVFLSFLFAASGSVGFVLAWSLYLLGTHRVRDVPMAWVVQEALRLWPVAWQFGRHPAKPHRVSGQDVDAGDEVVVCPYLVHRNPEYWSDPTQFRPERWGDAEAWRNPAYIPFGHGPHRCVAADLSTRLIANLLDALHARGDIVVEPLGAHPTVAAAMAPPPFRLRLVPRDAAIPPESCRSQRDR